MDNINYKKKSLSLEEKIKLCYKIINDKKATKIVVLDLKTCNYITDSFFLCSTGSARQSQAIADEIIEKLKKNKLNINGIEGYTNGKWILIDIDDLVVHIFHEEVRDFYNLERMWGNKKINL